MESIILQIRKLLQAAANEETKQGALRFFKEEIINYGVKSPVVQRIAKDIYPEIKDKSKEEILTLCDQLWNSGYIEESFVACVWSEKLQKQYVPDDFIVFERWINNNVSNWASCDTLCNHTVGEFVMNYPQFISRLKEFARSESRWVKRAAAVTLIIPARRGLFLNDIFEIADIMLTDPDDLVQKGYGWMLKAASEAHQQQVFEYVLKNKAIMPRTALRYAIEKMPKELKTKAMEK
jgi:3-methyladenine DNA glycosylase AlkD